MSKLAGLLTAAAIGAVLIIGSSSAALAASKRAPLGYQLMCLQHPAECQGGGKAKVSASHDLMKTLKQVNTAVNRAIKPQNDQGPDVWSVSATSGDCEDYVLAKRRHLIRAGVPASALRIAYVKTRGGIGHAVLVVNTERGKVVLDNRTSAIKPLSQTGYRLVSMQGSDPRDWS